MKYASAIFELAGMAAVCFGAYQLAEWVGWVVIGILTIVIGVAMGRPT